MLLPELFGTREVERLRDVVERVHAEVAAAGKAVRVAGVTPGSGARHAVGRPAVGGADEFVRRDPQDPTGLLVDPTIVDESRALTIEAAAGSVLMFPGLMIHRSAPNHTPTDRRSLLYCFQPDGRPHLPALHYDPERLADLP